MAERPKRIIKENKNFNEKDFESYDEEDDDYDYDQDFKMKCQQNLKLSKKLKKNSAKHQKELLNGEEGSAQKKYKTNGVNNVTPSAIGASSMPTKGRNTSKKFKKGFATSKQRLGKLLKINRIVNI
jgi:protease II